MALLDFALPKWKADEHVRMDDAYKWLYQATRGGEHAAPEREMAKRWLDREWSTLAEAAKDEPLWEPLCPGEEIGRLNLRAFKAKGGLSDGILDAFLASAAEYRSTPEDFTRAWQELGLRLKKKSMGTLTHADWLQLDEKMKAENYPAVHHSKEYNKARHPAYRIITRAEMVRLRSSLNR